MPLFGYTPVSEFDVNQTVASDGGDFSPDVTKLANGDFVVTWCTSGENNGTDHLIAVRVFAPDGTPRGPATTITVAMPAEPSIAALTDGGFVVTWADNMSRYARFDAGGSQVGAVVNVASGFGLPDVAGLPDGGWVIVYSGQVAERNGAYSAVYSSTGNRSSTDVVYEMNEDGFVDRLGVTALPDGSFAITGREIRAGFRNFNPEDVIFLVGGPGYSFGPSDQIIDRSAVATLPDGGLVVSWSEAGDVHAQLFAPDGGAPLTTFIVAGGATSQTRPEIAVLPDGRFFIAWTAPMQSSSTLAVHGQLFNADGSPVEGGFFEHSAVLSHFQASQLSVVALDNDRIMVSWAPPSGESPGTMKGAIFLFEQGVVWTGTPGEDSFRGTGADDTASGLGANDTIVTLAGNDLLDGGEGDDRLEGGRGDDTYRVDSPGDVVVELASQGNDRLFTSVSYALSRDASVELLAIEDATGTASIDLTGSRAAQTIVGNAGANSIRDGGGADSLIGLGGNDIYYVDGAGTQVSEAEGDGRDTVYTAVTFTLLAGSEVEILSTNNHAGTASIALFGNEFSNALYGNAGDNLLNGGGGADTLVGFGGHDTYIVDSASDLVIEALGAGHDRIIAFTSYVLAAGSEVETIETDSITGTSPIDLIGNAHTLVVRGNNGDNVLGGGRSLSGQFGNDTYHVDSSSTQVSEQVAAGYDRVFTSVSFALGEFNYIEEVIATGTASINLTGNRRGNVFIGNEGDNVLSNVGENGRMAGLGGNDVYYIQDAGIIVEEAAGGGRDTLYVDRNYVLPSTLHVEILSAMGHANTAPINLTGNGFNNEIWGNAGANILVGGGGADVLVGLGGNDVYFIDGAGSRVHENENGGRDVVYTSVNLALQNGTHVEILSTNHHAGTAAINLTGNDLAQEIWGNAGANQLRGGGGADHLIGLGGDDLYFIDDAAARVHEAAGAGRDTVYASISYTLGSGQAVEILSASFHAGTAAINLTGNELAQEIWGNEGVNRLDGGGGGDFLIGLGGDDIYIVDMQSVQIVEASGGGRDTVYTSVSYAAAAEVEVLSTNYHGGNAAIDLAGNSLANELWGNAGQNLLDGKDGDDALIGFGGLDVFAFTTALGAGNIDRIVDFQGGLDKIALDDAIFTGLPGGSLSANAFVVGAAAQDADDRIVYDAASGALYFDADGNGAGAAVQFAFVTAGLNLTANDFIVI